MDFTNEQLKTLRNRIARETMESATIVKHNRVTRVTDDYIQKLDIAAQEINDFKREQKKINDSKMHYMRVTPDGAKFITKEQHDFEVEHCPKSWAYVTGPKNELLKLIRERNITLK